MTESVVKDVSSAEMAERLRRLPATLPVLPMRDMVIYPYIIQPLCVGRPMSRKALEIAMAQDRYLLLLAQRDPSDEDPAPEDLYTVGTVVECDGIKTCVALTLFARAMPVWLDRVSRCWANWASTISPGVNMPRPWTQCCAPDFGWTRHMWPNGC